MIKRKINFSFYRRKGAPNRTRFKEAHLVAYASLQKFSKYTYYLGGKGYWIMVSSKKIDETQEPVI